MKHIFEHRIESASQRLESLDAVLSRMDGRASDVRSLRDELANQRGQINETLATLTIRIQNILALCNETNPDVGFIKLTAVEVQKHVTRLVELIAGARAKAAGISCVQLDPTALTKRNQEFKAKIEKGKAQLENIRDEGRGISPWANFRDVNDTWIEYLDYLAGLCLRHEGVDDGVCEIADALINEFERSSEDLSALAIPGRDSGSGTLPRAVYLRFPEWTVWALPLATRELWHIARKEAFIGTGFLGFAKRSGAAVDVLKDEVTGPRLHEGLADVFATYVMGPAYACAALLLALDPLRGPHRERAAIILSTLRWLGTQGTSGLGHSDVSELNVYARVHRRLEEHWEEAVAEAGASDDGDHSFSAWADVFIKYLDKFTKLRFPTHRWVAIREDWVTALRTNHTDDLPIDGATVRFALNAAWKARLEEPQHFEGISESCTKLCRRIMDDGHATRLAALSNIPSPGRAPNWT